MSTCPVLLPPHCTQQTGPEGKSHCTQAICQGGGTCIPDPSNSLYRNCVTQFIANKTVSSTCQCNNMEDSQATIDIYLLNKTNQTLDLASSPALNWVTLGKNGHTCDGGFWQLAPPPSVLPQGAFMARAFSGRHKDGDACCHDTNFYICFTYGTSDGTSDFVTIQVSRKRKHRNKKSGKKCKDTCNSFETVISHSTHKGLKVQSNILDYSTVQLIVTGGKVTPRCTFGSGDICPDGSYCPGEGLICKQGCKIDPLPSGSCDKTEVCSPTNHVCIVATTCTVNTGCNLNSICNEQGICVAGCVVGEDRCSAGRTCTQGQCQTGTGGNGGNGGNGDGTSLKVILIIVVVIVAFIVIFGGIIYAVYVYKKKK